MYNLPTAKVVASESLLGNLGTFNTYEFLVELSTFWRTVACGEYQSAKIEEEEARSLAEMWDAAVHGEYRSRPEEQVSQAQPERVADGVEESATDDAPGESPEPAETVVE